MEDVVASLCDKLRRGTTKEYTRSLHIARKTAEVLRVCVSTSRTQTAKELIREIKQVERMLTKEQPLAFAVGNIVRRVIKFVRDEEQQEQTALLEAEEKQKAGEDPGLAQQQQVSAASSDFLGPSGLPNKKLAQLRQSLALGQAMKRAPSLNSIFDTTIEEAAQSETGRRFAFVDMTLSLRGAEVRAT